MTEPHATIAGAATGALAGAAGGLVFGAHPFALAVGLFASVLVSFAWPPINDRRKAAAAVLFASLSAGYVAPVLAVYAASQVNGLPGGDPLTLALAVVIGATVPTVTPSLFARLNKLIGGQS